MPFPNSRVIPRGWERIHRPVSEGMMTAVGRLTRPATDGRPVFDEATATSTYPAPAVLWEGAVRFGMTAGPPGSTPVGGRDVNVQDYTFAIPTRGTPLVQVGDLFEIVECSGDPASVGMVFKVAGPRRGALSFDRGFSGQLQPPPTTR